MPKLSNKLRYFVTNPAWLFWLLPWYGVVLITGTVAQKYVGLYQAQKAIFNAVIWWAGPIPLLGGQGVLIVLALGLAAKLLWRSPWRWQRFGINLIHVGAIALLLSGALTASQQEEGYIVIPEGQQTAVVQDYHAREVVIAKNDQIIWQQSFSTLKPAQIIVVPDSNIKLQIKTMCQNCVASGSDWQEGPPALQQEESRYGFTFMLADKLIGVSEFQNIPTELPDDYTIEVRKAQRVLPFALKLEKFDEQLYPGSEIAKEYQSNLQIIDKGVAWPARVAMNEPLHHGGYTFFQSSFERQKNTTATVLSVVHNQARWGLYLATALIIGGLIIYLGQRYVKAL